VARAAKSAGSRRRTQSALMASHLARSKRAGLPLTRLMSNASTISAIENTSRSSASDQPSKAR
jgi:hypothetical protein